MPVKSFKFVSPGIMIHEIDNSALPAEPSVMGPIIIGRSRMGPGMRPIKVNSFSDFVTMYGNPVPGKGGGDVWREGNTAGPTYGAYGAQAYFKPDVGPVTYLRLLGTEHPSANLTSTHGLAGWATTNTNTDDPDTNGGAYGLFVCRSGSGEQPGYLGAIFYVEDGGLILTGTLAQKSATSVVTGGTCGFFEPTNDLFEYKMAVLDNAGNSVYETSFNFNEGNKAYIRNVFNTNPHVTNTTIVKSTGFAEGQNQYWLGESYASWINLKGSDKTPADQRLSQEDAYAILLPLEQPSSPAINKTDYRFPFTKAKTGWFFSQDVSTDSASYSPNNMLKLFRLVSQDGGRWLQDNIKVSIENIRATTDTSGNPELQYGTFSVVLRSASDTDKNPVVIERYSNVNLNDDSPRFIAKVIGNKFMEWDTTPGQERLLQKGEYDNQSKYIRVELSDQVEMNTQEASLLPFGVYGPNKFICTLATSGSAMASSTGIITGGDESLFPVTGSEAGGISTGAPGVFELGNYSASLCFPEVALRHTASVGMSNPTNAYFGLQTALKQEEKGATSLGTRYDPGYVDYLWALPGGMEITDFPSQTGDSFEPQWAFTLDDIVVSSTSSVGGEVDDVVWISGSRASQDSITCGVSGAFTNILSLGYDRFTAPFFGGFDGLDITEMEPFRNSLLSDFPDPKTNYAFYTIQRAIQTVSDPEFVECNVITMPGLTEPLLTKLLVETCAERSDALAIIDIPHVYTPFTENDLPPSQRFGNVKEASDALAARQLGSQGSLGSYGCTYYPWVQIKDTIKGNVLWAPPSVPVLGTFANTQAKKQVWFAPAGFNRGGLNATSAIPVLNVSERVTSKDRDTLYMNNINPIAKFPAEGIVVFGQKTLQQTQTALDRINVRRLLVYIKKQVSIMASEVIFDQNTVLTWGRFKSAVEPFLAGIQSQQGLTDWKVILDGTTTTPKEVDQNIMYAKIFLKPARAIEFIAIDFYITRTGASFDD
jgi:hypothetical protein